MSDSPHPQLVLDILPADQPTLANYVAGANGAAVQAIRSLQPGRAVFLWGLAGTGRSHLLQAATAATPDARLLTALSPVDTWPINDVQGRLPTLIAIDDVHTLDTDGQARLFALYNHWRAAAATPQGCRLLLTGDRAPAQMAVREDLRTRLAWDLVFQLQPLSDNDLRTALLAFSEHRRLSLAPQIIDWLLTRQARDLRRLTAILDALDRYSLAARRPITLPLLKTMLATPTRGSTT